MSKFWKDLSQVERPYVTENDVGPVWNVFVYKTIIKFLFLNTWLLNAKGQDMPFGREEKIPTSCNCVHCYFYCLIMTQVWEKRPFWSIKEDYSRPSWLHFFEHSKLKVWKKRSHQRRKLKRPCSIICCAGAIFWNFPALLLNKHEVAVKTRNSNFDGSQMHWLHHADDHWCDEFETWLDRLLLQKPCLDDLACISLLISSYWAAVAQLQHSGAWFCNVIQLSNVKLCPYYSHV